MDFDDSETSGEEVDATNNYKTIRSEKKLEITLAELVGQRRRPLKRMKSAGSIAPIAVFRKRAFDFAVIAHQARLFARAIKREMVAERKADQFTKAITVKEATEIVDRNQNPIRMPMIWRNEGFWHSYRSQEGDHGLIKAVHKIENAHEEKGNSFGGVDALALPTRFLVKADEDGHYADRLRCNPTKRLESTVGFMSMGAQDMASSKEKRDILMGLDEPTQLDGAVHFGGVSPRKASTMPPGVPWLLADLSPSELARRKRKLVMEGALRIKADSFGSHLCCTKPVKDARCTRVDAVINVARGEPTIVNPMIREDVAEDMMIRDDKVGHDGTR